MNTNQSNIRFNSLARSCNDDYCPLMEELCVKMSRLSLQADPKMEAYDAELEQSFYEEKVDNEIDDKNEETFGETDYEAELNEFNDRYGTNFSINDLDIFNAYVEHTGLTIEDALKYNQVCHTCGDDLDQLNQWGCEYCNDHCRDEFGEGPHRECFHGNSCLICHGYPETTCYWAQKGCDRCDAYEGPEEDRYPYSCTYCFTQMTDHEGYNIDDDFYCNNCAVYLFDKTEHLDDQDNDDQDNDEQDNDSKKRPRDPESDDEESDSKRQRVNEKKTRDMMSKLTDESCDIWDLALDINNGDKEAALDMIEDQPRLRAHPRVIEYYRAKNEDMDFEECSSECSEESSQDDDLQKRKRARVSDDDVIELDISDVESESDVIVIDLLDDDDAPNAMVIDLVSDDEDEDEDEDEDANSYEDECYDYAESVVDDDGVVEMEEDEVPNQHLYNAMLQMEEENASLRHELHVMRTQRHMLFPEGSSISITIEEGQRYINIHDAIPPANNSPMTLNELDGDDDESSCGEEVSCDEEEEVSCDEEEDNMDYLDMDESD